MCKKVAKRLVGTRARMQLGPTPCWPCKCDVAHEITARAQCFAIRIPRISRQYSVGKVAILGLCRGHMGPRACSRNKGYTFIGIGTDENWRIDIVAGVVDLIFVATNDVVIHNRPPL